MKKTKIIATIGPATSDEKKILSLYKEGVNIIRFNFSHADYDTAKKQISIIKKLNESSKTNLSILLDTKGPEIRTGTTKEPINIIKGKEYKICVNKKYIKSSLDIFCDYPDLINDVKIGNEIIIDSGLLKVKVIGKNKNYILVKANNSILLTSRRHINLPGIRLNLPGITKKDKKDIEFALLNDFDFLAASFIRNKKGIKEIRKIFEKHNNKTIKLISKIENEEALDNLDEIIEYSDGIMVARGDLGIETPIEKLPVYQTQMIKRCNYLGKFVIIATHFLETMILNQFPTRAETSDIFNTVIQKPDAIMLSGETAIGEYPIQSVSTMEKVIIEAEKNIKYIPLKTSDEGLTNRNIEKKYLIEYSIELGQKLNFKAVIILTKTGFLSKLASQFKPIIPIYAFTKYKKSVNIMNIYYGINPIFLDDWDSNNFNKNLDNSIKYLINKKVINKKDRVIAVTDIQRDGSEFPIMEIINVGDLL